MRRPSRGEGRIPSAPTTRVAVFSATAASTAMIAYQVAGKATRDALFLTTFRVQALPLMVIAAAVFSLVVVLGATRLMTTRGPGRLIPIVLAISSLLMVAEGALLGTFPRTITVIFYLHFNGLGALLVSGFWSIVNELFDPRTAKAQIGRIAAGGTFGGLLGGVLAERVAATMVISSMLPSLAALHLVSAVLLVQVTGGARGQAGAALMGDRALVSRSGLRVIAATPYLRSLTAFVVLGAVSEGLLDFVFKAQASDAFGRGNDLLRLFAAFYTGVSLFSILVQVTVSRLALARLGLARTSALLPATVAIGGAAALLHPGVLLMGFARGSEAVVRNSLYRSAYELLFAPLPPLEKRSTKLIVDVGVVRLGDILGGGLVKVTLMLAAASANTVLLAMVVGLAAVGLLVARRLHAGYVAALERSLVARAGELDLQGLTEMTEATLLHSVGGLDLTQFRARVAAPRSDGDVSAVSRDPTPVVPSRLSPELARIADLRSGDQTAVRQALSSGPLTPDLVSHAIALLAWDAVAEDTITALRGVVRQCTGQLIDRLLDPNEEFAVRRRIPLILGFAATNRALDGLLQALEDPRFEVRYRAGRALSRILSIGKDLAVDPRRVFRLVDHEVTVDREVWEGRRLLDRMEDEEWSPVMDELLLNRANRSLEHVFTLLSFVLPRQPLRIAFQGLHTDDALLRGTALEYLETALPETIRKKLLPFLEGGRASRLNISRPSAQVMADLLKSSELITGNLERLRRQDP